MLILTDLKARVLPAPNLQLMQSGDRIALHAVFVGWMDRGNLAEHLDCIPPMVTFPRRLDFTCQQMIARQTDQ